MRVYNSPTKVYTLVGLHFGDHESFFIQFIGRRFQTIVGVDNILELVVDKVKNTLDELDFGVVLEKRALEKSQQIGHYLEDVLLDFERDGAFFIGESEKFILKSREDALNVGRCFCYMTYTK